MLLCACLCVTQCQTSYIYFFEKQTRTQKMTELKMTKPGCPKKNIKNIFYENDNSESPFKNVIPTSCSRHQGNMSHFISPPQAATQYLVCHRSSFGNKYVIAIPQTQTYGSKQGSHALTSYARMRYVCILKQLTVKGITWITSGTQ